jgi:hypothetical protein
LWWRRTSASARPRPGSRSPRPHQQSSTLLGTGLLGPNGGSETNDPSARRSRRLLSSSDISATPGRRSCLQPLCPCPRGGAPRRRRGKLWPRRWGSRQQSGGLQPTHWISGYRDGVPATGLANCDAALVEGRQRGQIHRPQPCVVAERRDALGED